MCELESHFKPIVLVTGFGPFADITVNASWEAVKLMNKDEIELKHNIELVKIELPVTYEHVDEFVPALWKTHTPKLMIHVGVTRRDDCIVLETQAHRKGYQKKDNFEKLPNNYTCSADGAIRLQSKLDIEGICAKFEKEKPIPDIYAKTSKDAGRYVCEYIYYTSLCEDNTRTIFVHVPDLQYYSSEKTARGLEKIVDLCLEQINKRDAKEQMSS